MNQYDHVFGVDVSKKTVDITHVINQQFTHRQFANNEAGMEQLMQWFEELTPAFDKTLFCMESTGLYCFTLTHFLAHHSIDTWIEHAAQIKKATALARGKNDKVDSQRIALYATKNLDLLRLWKPVNATLEKIKHLASLRERLVDTKKRLATPIKEFEDVGNLAMGKLLTKTIKSSLAAIDKDLKNIELKISDVIMKMII